MPTVHVPKGPPPKKLIVRELKRGSGTMIEPYTKISTHFVGVTYSTGKPYEVRWKGYPFTIDFGPGEEIKGWEKGLVGMRVGGRRELVIPSKLAYGKGAMVYVIDLLSVEK